MLTNTRLKTENLTTLQEFLCGKISVIKKMDLLKKKIAVQRAGFLKSHKLLTDLIIEKAASSEVKITFDLLESKFKALKETTESLMNIFFETSDVSDEYLEKAQEEADSYESKYIRVKHDVEQYTASFDSNTTMTAKGKCDLKKSAHLKKIKLLNFRGSVREWLRFWSLFKEFHEDEHLNKEEKFRYLLESIVVGSRASNLIKNYPPTGDNYDKAIESLRNRFGREDLQVEVYVKELLQLVRINSMKTNKISLINLYDELKSYLHALKMLGVITEKYAAMLYPLVEATLPQDLLIAWKNVGKVPNDLVIEDISMRSLDRLAGLIKCLEEEVENELRFTLSKKDFELKLNGLQELDNENDIVDGDASNLLGHLSMKSEELKCIFCDSKNHKSKDCREVEDFSLYRKKGIAMKHRACFNCLKTGHGFTTCWMKQRCSKCGAQHVEIMCPEKNDQPDDCSGQEFNE